MTTVTVAAEPDVGVRTTVLFPNNGRYRSGAIDADMGISNRNCQCDMATSVAGNCDASWTHH